MLWCVTQVDFDAELAELDAQTAAAQQVGQLVAELTLHHSNSAVFSLSDALVCSHALRCAVLPSLLPQQAWHLVTCCLPEQQRQLSGWLQQLF